MKSEISRRALSEFCWNVLDVDPDDVLNLSLDAQEVTIERAVRDGEGHLIPIPDTDMFLIRTDHLPVSEDG